MKKLIILQRFMHQLRNGCGVSTCMVSTCFTCRKRLAGKAPIRRYNVSSARTLAVYLAGRDNPEDGLCPALRQTKDVSKPSMNGLILTTARHDLFPIERKRSTGHSKGSKPKLKSRPDSKPAPGPQVQDSNQGGKSPSKHVHRSKRNHDAAEGSLGEHETPSTTYEYTVRERPSNKDHRSFAANVFGTVAFRMLEWLTPQAHATMKDQWSRDANEEAFGGTASKASSITSPRTDVDIESETITKSMTVLSTELPEKLSSTEPLLPSPSKDPVKSRRSSEATFRTTQATKPNRRKSLDPPPQQPTVEDPRSPTRSPKMSSIHGDRPAPPLKTNPTALPRSVIGISKVFENVQPIAPLASDVAVEPDQKTVQEDGVDHEPQVVRDSDTKPSCEIQEETTPPSRNVDEASSTAVDYPLPQSLSRLNTQIVEFICNTFDEDRTSESLLDDEFLISKPPQAASMAKVALARRKQGSGKVPTRQWKAFNEQTLFHVLSNPHALVESFTENGKLFDSQTLSHCMERLTKAKPSLVFHSLWMAAESLFDPPRALQKRKLNTKGGPSPSPRILSNFERGCVMSICLHALIGSIPVPPETNIMSELSLIRSKGLTLSYFKHALTQPNWFIEQYDDAFSNDLATRLARRICCAVTAHEQFTKVLKFKGIRPREDQSPDMVTSVIRHITIFGAMESPRQHEIEPDERFVYEERSQALVLDWAKTVLFHDWDGQPVFPTNGPFAGALALIKAMCTFSRPPFETKTNQNDTDNHGDGLLIVDTNYSTDYFSDRLDSLEVPIAWLDFLSTENKGHLLDHPYLFSQDRLVSFFRSINFYRMSSTFEESSSLKTRMKAILERGSLITNTHHKTVLQDLLKTASAKYLVLQISRDSVLRDAFNQLWRREERELLRPLKVRLGEDDGEEGFDSGGVQQEFFRLAIAECLDPNHGAFTIDDRTRMAWFAPGSLVESWKFELMGLLVSLAVFNGLTLPVTFPKALYRKLLDWPVEDLSHIEDGWPSLASGLQSLLEWDEENGSVEDIFSRTYEFSVSTHGSHVTRHMTSDDSSWPQMGESEQATDELEEAPLVTAENRRAYVKDYVRYLTDVSVRPQFAAFERGFRACLVPKSLRLLNPSLLQSLVEGEQEIDIAELRRYTRYVGWDASHHTVKDFWSIVKRYDENMKRRLLEFVTASDRLPVGGMQNLQFVVQKNGEEEGEGGHLPTAYTCYGTLLLPEYRDKEVLKKWLTMALENAQGFGFA